MMYSERMCCVPCYSKIREDNIILHRFASPQNDPERFRSWVFAVGGNILTLEDMYVYKYRRVSHLHFEPCYWIGKKLLSNIATPTLHIKGPAVKKYPLKDVTNINSVASPSAETFMPARAPTSNEVSMADETPISLKICDQGVLSEASKDTADLILFIDNLFDSFNGSSNNCAKRSGKALLHAVTPKSAHEEVWICGINPR